MEKEVDVITLCKRLNELTKQEKCSWKETSENNRFKLILKNGTIDIYHFIPDSMDILKLEYYEVSLSDKSGFRYATYRSVSGDNEGFKTFRALFKEIKELLERNRRRKIAVLFNELETPGETGCQ